MNAEKINQIKTFLFTLDPSEKAVFNVESYPDNKEDRTLIRNWANLSLNEVLNLNPTLTKLNELGAGIFVAVNEFEGKRKKSAIKSIRGIHADFDNQGSIRLNEIRKYIEPTLIVNSSKNKFHAYWITKNKNQLTLLDSEILNKNIARNFQSDIAATDATRLLRLPGFKNMKGSYRSDENLVRIHHISENKYDEKTLFLKFGDKGYTTSHINTNPKLDIDDSLVTKVSQQVMTLEPDLWSGQWMEKHRGNGEIGYNSQSEADLALATKISEIVSDQIVEKEEISNIVEKVFSNSELANREKWSRSDYRDRTISKAISFLKNTTNCPQTPFGDIWNSEKFVALYEGKLAFISDSGKWLKRSDENIWEYCNKGEETQAGINAIQQFLIETQELLINNSPDAKSTLSHLCKSQSLSKINSMLDIAKTSKKISVINAELDSNPWLLGVKNGVVNLKTGHLLKNEPNMYITKLCNVHFEKNTSCPTWLNFLDQLFPEDLETIETIQRAIGYSLTGLTTEEVIFICYGYGSNGKSVFNNVLMEIFGTYGKSAPNSLLVTRNKNDGSPRNDLAGIVGARLVSINELQGGDRLDEAIVKQLAGREKISTRFLYKEFFEYQPSFKCWLRTNHRPIITGDDDGIWRRLILIPFEQKFIDTNKDPDIERKLLLEKNGILNWAIEGCLKWQRDGLKVSKKIHTVINDYRSDSDILGEFISDKYRFAPVSKILDAEMYRDWVFWCEENGYKPMTKISFTRRLSERGHKIIKSNGKRFYSGIEKQH